MASRTALGLGSVRVPRALVGQGPGKAFDRVRGRVFEDYVQILYRVVALARLSEISTSLAIFELMEFVLGSNIFSSAPMITSNS